VLHFRRHARANRRLREHPAAASRSNVGARSFGVSSSSSSAFGNSSRGLLIPFLAPDQNLCVRCRGSCLTEQRPQQKRQYERHLLAINILTRDPFWIYNVDTSTSDNPSKGDESSSPVSWLLASSLCCAATRLLICRASLFLVRSNCRGERES
jgi:hypothetical protein